MGSGGTYHREVELSRKTAVLNITLNILEKIDMEKDPICGMDVDPKTAARKSEFQRKTYYFCAPGCKASFDKDPGKYANTGKGVAGQDESHVHATW